MSHHSWVAQSSLFVTHMFYDFFLQYRKFWSISLIACVLEFTDSAHHSEQGETFSI
jgi:hypothetical protein